MKQKKLEKMYLNKEHRYGLREKEKPSITSLFSIWISRLKVTLLGTKRNNDLQRHKAMQHGCDIFFPVDTTYYSNTVDTVANRRCKRTGRLV